MTNAIMPVLAVGLDEAATWLFVPAIRPDRVQKALDSRADVVVIDLEDAVPESQKQAARTVLATVAGSARVVVRINAESSRFHQEDVDAVRASGLAVMIAKCERPETVAEVWSRCRTPIVPLLETARGLAATEAIATQAGTSRVAFGNMDFALDVGADPTDGDALLLARSRIVYASALAALPAPIDGITTAVRDASQTARDAARARKLGFGGKLCIHPDQLEPAAAAFLPDERELKWARAILSSGAHGASVVDEGFVDPPIRARAERIVARSGRARAAVGRTSGSDQHDVH